MDYVFHLLSTSKCRRIPCSIGGVNFTIKRRSQRLRLFLKSYEKTGKVTCVKCGIEGAYFMLQAVNDEKPHINLYTKNGILMTKDHIVPKSKGGKDCMSNYQVMCATCNMKKGNTNGNIQ